MTDEKDFEYSPSSNISENYLKHVEAMKPLDEQPENKSFAISKEGYSLELLRDIARAKSVGKKAYVVVEWTDVFEVQRLPNGSDTKLFYRYLKIDKHKDIDKTVEEIKRILNEYAESDFGQCLKYDKKLTHQAKNENIISYAYIQRRSSGLASFRKAAESAKSRLKATIEKLIADSYLTAVPQDVAENSFGTKGVLYQILKN